MAEAQKQFEAWFEEYADKNDIRLAINYGAYDIAGDAWQHQQQRIEELESKLKIAVDALNEIGSANWHFSMSRKIANDALKQIEVK